MKIKLFILFAGLFVLVGSCKVADVTSTSRPVTHEQWDSLLKQHVDEAGWVNYDGFKKDSLAFNKYLNLLEANHPNDKYWTRDERMAYWINAYNAYTIKLVSDNYPAGSIKDIKNGIPFVNTVWDIKFIEIEGHAYDLNNIEHGILRPKFEDPRIHFAVNCASVSCPPLANFAYSAEKLNEQLDQMGTRFINDKSRNKIDSPSKGDISAIFSWFKGDFTKESNLIDFLNRYSIVQLNSDAKIDHLDYDWNINDPRSK